MKILILSNTPNDFETYERSLLSKIYSEINKEIEIEHIFYLLKGFRISNKFNFVIFEMPFIWKHFYQKIANMFFIFFNNIKLLRNSKHDLIMLSHGNGMNAYSMFFYPLLFPAKVFFVSTATPAVERSILKRKIADSLSILVLKPYKHIGIDNMPCKHVFKIPDKKVRYSSVGYPEYTFHIKEFKSLSLVYLGTLDNRDIWKTVVGFKIFTQKYPDVKITYDIIGGGEEKEILLKTIKENDLQELIRYHGFQPGDSVNEIFGKCNIGVAFVPLLEYYDNVYTTKAMEYLLAGMPIIATRTSFAKETFSKEAGVLCEDTPQDFAKAIEEIYNNREQYNSEQIREIYKNYGMSNIIKNEYIPMLKSLI